jgi:glycosyltransferase involved in cell wall biosynthesis
VGRRREWFSDGVRCIWTPGLNTNSLSTLSFGATANLDASMRHYDAALVLNVANGFYLPLLRARGIPVVVNTDGLEWERGKWSAMARRIFRTGAALTARYADVLVADSIAIAAIWKSLFQVESMFIPYGALVLASPGSDRVCSLGLSPRQYVLVVARLNPENNVDLILDASELLPTRPRLVVVGAATSKTSLGTRLRESHLAGKLTWLGHVDDQVLLTQLWANAGVYVHGHSVGGTNPGLVQALGAGAPTLALDTAFNREVIRSAEQTFTPDAGELAGKIAMTLGDAQRQDAFARHGQQVVGAHYIWADVSSRYLEALRQAQRQAAVRTGR